MDGKSSKEMWCDRCWNNNCDLNRKYLLSEVSERVDSSASYKVSMQTLQLTMSHLGLERDRMEPLLLHLNVHWRFTFGANGTHKNQPTQPPSSQYIETKVSQPKPHSLTVCMNLNIAKEFIISPAHLHGGCDGELDCLPPRTGLILLGVCGRGMCVCVCVCVCAEIERPQTER